MKKKNSILLVVLVVAVMVMSPAWVPQDGKRDIQAILVKVINNVEKNVPSKGFTKAVNYDQLKAGYDVRTGAKSIAVVKFLDNSKLVVREKSLATISGQVQGKEILDRTVHMTKGGIKFDVTKGNKEQFRFTSPISVASIRGTSGDWGQTDSVTTYVMLSGLLNLLNLNSNRSEDVGAGQTAGRAAACHLAAIAAQLRGPPPARATPLAPRAAAFRRGRHPPSRRGPCPRSPLSES